MTNQDKVVRLEQELDQANKNLQQQQQNLDKLLLEKYEPIAIVGVGLRFPGGCNTLEDFASLLDEGRDGTGPIPKDRWDNDKYFSEQPGARGKITSSGGGFIDDFDAFDEKFFSISPKEARYMDPQQRIVMQVAWEALENANIAKDKLVDSDGGVFMGVSAFDHMVVGSSLDADDIESQMGTGGALSAISGRLSYFLGWRGPSMTIDTACSSSMVAMHSAITALRNKECNIALAGGVNIIHHPSNHIILSRAGMLSPDGRCKTFDERADGYGRSEGCGVVVLKRLSDATKNNDNVLALLRGSAVRQDGNSGGLAVPSGRAQEMVMSDAVTSSALVATDINYVEAHGTGTPIGDPIELGAINEVFGKVRDHKNPIAVGSVKTNVGHMEAAASMGGLIKVILQVQHKRLYPHIHMENPSSHIPWDTYRVTVPLKNQQWEVPCKRAMINSFGFAGTIAAVVVQEPPRLHAVVEKKLDKQQHHLITISAQSRPALFNLFKSYQQYGAEQKSDVSVADICYTSQMARDHHAYRVAGRISTTEDLNSFISKTLASFESKSSEVLAVSSVAPKPALLFTGQGAQYAGMAATLYEQLPLFQYYVDLCDQLFRNYYDNTSIKEIMFNLAEDDAHLIDQTEFTQPALFTLEYAMAMTLIRWGLQPSVLIGHSIGEIVAACVAGLFNLNDATKLVAKRAQLMQSVKKAGGMTAVNATEVQVAAAINGIDNITFAAINAPSQCVISGDICELKKIHRQFNQRNINYTPLPVSHAFHSPLMNEIFDEFRKVLEQINFNAPKITLISNISGDVADVEQMQTAEYWVRHIAEPVRFSSGIQAIEKRGEHLFIEVGPSAALTALGKQSATNGHQWVSTLNKNIDSMQSFTDALAKLYVNGIDLDWNHVYQDRECKKVALPLYPFDKKSYRMPLTRSLKQQSGQAEHALLGRKLVDENTSYQTFMAHISPNSPSFLADHVVMDQFIFPGAGYIEIALALQVEVFGEVASIEALEITRPLILSEDNTTVLQTRLYPEQEGKYQFEIVSVVQTFDDSTNQIESQQNTIVRLHAQGYIYNKVETIDYSDLQSRVSCIPDEFGLSDSLYEEYENMGLQYGPNFRKINHIGCIDELNVVAEMHPHIANVSEVVSPTILDATLQSTRPVVGGDEVYLPIVFTRLHCFKRPRGNTRSVAYVHSKIEDENDCLMADVLLVDDNGPVLFIEGIVMKRVLKSQRAVKSLLYKTQWVKKSLQEMVDKPTGKQLVIGDLPLLRVDSEFVTVAKNVELALEILRKEPSYTGVTYYWSGEKHTTLGDITTTLEVHYQSLLYLVKRLDTEFFNLDIKLYFLTDSAQVGVIADEGSVEETQLLASTLWGFGATLLKEYPSLAPCMIDVDKYSNISALLSSEWSLRSRKDYRIAYRHDQRFIQKIKPMQQVENENKALVIEDYGVFSNIKLNNISRRAPADSEVEIQVKAAGLNFKDVLNALGMLKEYAEEMNLEYKELPLGYECSGVVVDVGAKSRFSVGDEVVVSQLGCMQHYITVDCDVVVRKPSNISFEEAAGLPTAYITAYYSLHTLAKLKKNERVLIHAGAGGVGQAAIQLAKRVGAEIFATASPHKWPLLEEQGVDHVMNSRTLEFADQIQSLTENDGVDVVINSLNKEFILKGFQSTAKNGRFIELGKIGVWDSQQAALVRDDVAYYNFDLGEFPEEITKEINATILSKVVDLIEDKHITPLPIMSFSVDEAEEAFSILSRGDNIGKVIISFENKDLKQPSPFSIEPDHAILITGGFGALGGKAATWLATMGARNLVLMSRRPVDEAALSEVRKAIGNDDVKVTAVSGDVANEGDIKRIINQNQPLGGIIHSAGVIADGLANSLSWDDFNEVYQAKVYGSYLLHKYTRDSKSLNFFVAYSSITSMLGSAAQSNYAAANSYIDQLMQWRCAHGLPGLAIQWGPWADIGMAASLSDSVIRSIEGKGSKFLKPAQGIEIMESLLVQGTDNRAVGEFDWPHYYNDQVVEQSLFTEVLVGEQSGAASFDIAALEGLSDTEQRQMINGTIRSRAAKLLQFDDANDIESDARFVDLGLDSLVIVELKNMLESCFKVPLKAAVLYDYPSIDAVAEHLRGKIVAD